MISEKDAQSGSAPAGAKEPWQMTQEEFLESQREYLGPVRPSGKMFGSLYREETGRATENPFFHYDLADVTGVYGDQINGYHGVTFKNPLHVESMADASRKLLGKNVYPDRNAPGYVQPVPGRRGEAENKLLAADKQVADAARKAGYDAVATQDALMVLDRSRLPEPEPATYEEGYALGHRRFVERALAAGKTVPPEVLKSYPDLVPRAQPLDSPLGAKVLHGSASRKIKVARQP